MKRYKWLFVVSVVAVVLMGNWYRKNVTRVASDLFQVCVIRQGPGCDFDYWTTNRGLWPVRLASFGSGAEGPSVCEHYEEWKVAKGMECIRLVGGEVDTVK